MRRLALLITAIVLTSCGGGSGNLAIVGSSPATIGLGPQRVVMAEVDPDSVANVAFSTYMNSRNCFRCWRPWPPCPSQR